ncbi:LacI family DNA-binding transcriptional regulator [Celerinatantimonas diazotrophica]|uniref:LacI family transcriptional regulator n=1 Tax=Celerinatantimonas diazotrophica TaxID=412034 RepID=A0A4R1K3H3_9GAMM|nr:LacI family DNA-binding transcriptional regulator [Celerinatantimonas diazotrophica]TCK58602.1 LacI family transcriptional regulator [Celerinatantimonas diazotrophica]CAG9297231.1 HTH-type transcriptional regulator GntR [Celerinatantimonas diazotrophica]
MEDKKLNRKKNVTLADIAKIVGVGSMTVSRAFRTPEKVSAELREQIEKVALELGYQIPIHNQSEHKTGLMLIYASDYLSYSQLFLALKKLLTAANIDFIIDASITNSNEEYNKLLTLALLKPEFVILSSAPHNGETVTLLKNLNIPVIEILSQTPVPIDINIGISQQKTIYELTCEHIKQGYSQICFISENHENWKSKQQIIGWQRAMINYGLNPDKTLSLTEDFSYTKASSLLPEILLRWPTTELILCGNMHMVNALICEAFRRKIKIPEVLSIASIGSHDLAQSLYPSISSADIPLIELAEDIFKVIKQSINGIAIEQKVMITEATIHLRQSSCVNKKDRFKQNDWI